MPGPSVVFGFLLATLYGSLTHFFAGGDARRLAFLLIAGWVGFALGQIMGELLNISIFNIGSLHFWGATVGAFVALITTLFLTRRNLYE